MRTSATSYLASLANAKAAPLSTGASHRARQHTGMQDLEAVSRHPR